MEIEQFKNNLINSYKFEIQMAEGFIEKFTKEGDEKSADIFKTRKSTFEEMVIALNIPGFYDDEWTMLMQSA